MFKNIEFLLLETIINSLDTYTTQNLHKIIVLSYQ